MQIVNCKLQSGYTLAGALCLLAVMAILMAMAVPLWSRVKQRDNEQELIFRGQEYMEAIGRYHAKFGAYPPDLETLQKLKYIRKLYPDPMTKSGKWKVLHPDSLVTTGAAGTIGGAPGTQPQEGGVPNPNQPAGRDEEEGEGGGRQQQRENKNDTGMEKDDEKSDEEPEVESKGPVVGVVSRSKKESMKIYNGQDTYNRWIFVYALPQQPAQPGQPGVPPPPGGTPGQKKPGKTKTQNPQGLPIVNDPGTEDDNQ